MYKQKKSNKLVLFLSLFFLTYAHEIRSQGNNPCPAKLRNFDQAQPVEMLNDQIQNFFLHLNQNDVQLISEQIKKICFPNEATENKLSTTKKLSFINLSI